MCFLAIVTMFFIFTSMDWEFPNDWRGTQYATLLIGDSTYCRTDTRPANLINLIKAHPAHPHPDTCARVLFKPEPWLPLSSISILKLVEADVLLFCLHYLKITLVAFFKTMAQMPPCCKGSRARISKL